ACRVRDEVRAVAPAKRLVHAARRKQALPPPCHRRYAADHDRDRPEEPAEMAVHDDVDRLADVELPQDVGETPAGDQKRQAEPDRCTSFHEVKRSCTRCSAAITSLMSSSECAGESGSDMISSPARSAT